MGKLHKNQKELVVSHETAHPVSLMKFLVYF